MTSDDALDCLPHQVLLEMPSWLSTLMLFSPQASVAMSVAMTQQQQEPLTEHLGGGRCSRRGRAAQHGAQHGVPQHARAGVSVCSTRRGRCLGAGDALCSTRRGRCLGAGDALCTRPCDGGERTCRCEAACDAAGRVDGCHGRRREPPQAPIFGKPAAARTAGDSSSTGRRLTALQRGQRKQLASASVDAQRTP